jgi:hypothetical protein
MLGFLLKNWKSMVDILLVIALIILFFIWNPFGIFGGGIKLRPTANLVTEIKEMGQLVTSEYYGEVIASIEESRINYLEEELIAEKATDLYDQLFEAMTYLKDFQNLSLEIKEASYEEKGVPSGRRKIIRNNVSRRNIIDKLNYHDLLADLSYEPLYGDILEFIWINEQAGGSWRGTSRQKEEALMLIYSQAVQSQEADLPATAFMPFYYSKKQVNIPKKESKKKLAMVGRGWVKAGFDFSKLDNTNFYINEEAGEAHFFGLSASILNSDINPWFIPERGIPGFEILDYNGKVDFKDARTLKLYCIEKLVAKAHEAAILKNAELHGAEILKNIFSLLSGKEIKKVFFHHDDIVQFSKAIAEDEYISYDEAVLLDSQITKEWATIGSLRSTRENSYKNNQLAQHREENIRQVLIALYSLPFEDLPGNFNKHSIMAYEIARDSILDETEWERVKEARLPMLQKELSQENLSNAAEFNSLLRYLMQQEVEAGSFRDTILAKTSFSELFLADNNVLSYEHIHPDSLKASLFINEPVPYHSLLELLYPYYYSDSTWEQTMSKETLVLDSLAPDHLESLTYTDSTTLLYVGKPTPHLKLIGLPVSQFIDPLLLEKHKGDDILWLSPDLSVILGAVPVKSLTHAKTPFLTATQSGEMEEFYRFLINSHQESKKIGPVVRANQWIQDKFENNTSLSEWFSKMKTKFSD